MAKVCDTLCRTEVTIAFQLPNARANEWSKTLGFKWL